MTTAASNAYVVNGVSVFEPRDWTLDVLRGMADHRFSVIVAHRGSGKTYVAAFTLFQAALTCTRADARFLFISPFLKQARDVVWVYLKNLARSIPGVDFQESLLQIRLPKVEGRGGAWICLYGADDPDALRSMHPDGIVMDEVAQMKPMVWSEVVSPMLHSHEAWILFIGTPKGVNLFSEIYYNALKDDDWYAGMFDVYQTGVLSEKEIEFQKKVKTDRQFAQEFLCDFNAGSDSTLISLDVAKAAAGRHLRPDQYAFAPRLLGVDAARYGDDRTVIIRRQGLAMFPPVITRGLDTGQVISLIVREAEDWSPDAIFVDVGGNAGVYDGVKKMRWPVYPVDFGSSPIDKRFMNRRAEIWCKSRDWLIDGGCIPDNNEILADACSTQYDYSNSRGKFALESKEDMRKRGLPSPDIWDAFCTTFHIEIAPKSVRFYPKSANLNNWDPLDPQYL